MTRQDGNNPATSNPVRQAMRRATGSFWAVGLFSAAVNILMLTGPVFMLQVYDRVLASRSVETLIALFMIVAVLYGFLALFDYVRARILSRVGVWLDSELLAPANSAWINGAVASSPQTSRPLVDLTVIRQFMASPGIPALFDLPWVPFYLAILYFIHPMIGLLGAIAAVVVIVLTLVNELVSKRKIGEAMDYELQDLRFSESAHRNAEAIVGLGMENAVTGRWARLRNAGMAASQHADVRSGFIAAMTKGFRLLVQSALLGLGAYYVILGQLTPGAMIAASILGGRALVPIDQAVGNWKNFQRARAAYKRLSDAIMRLPPQQQAMDLPEPEGRLSVEHVTKMARPAASGPDAASRPILTGINFNLEPGDALGVIGPSASGKSSLGRLLVGIWQPDRGSVRLDGATHDSWDRQLLGRHVGYLPQSVELLPGTVRDNIARFDPSVTDEEVVAAARTAGVHDLILRLQDGYATDLAVGMQMLSGGQIQRIALARAVLRQPALVVLDEPNSNLDADGDAALAAAIQSLRAAGSCVVVMAHRPSAIASVNKVLVLREGRQAEFGDKEPVLRKMTRPVSDPQPQAPARKATANFGEKPLFTGRMEMMRPGQKDTKQGS